MTPDQIEMFDGLMLYLRDAIGTYGTIFIPMAFLLSVFGLVSWMVRHYLSRGKDDGGGGPMI